MDQTNQLLPGFEATVNQISANYKQSCLNRNVSALPAAAYMDYQPKMQPITHCQLQHRLSSSFKTTQLLPHSQTNWSSIQYMTKVTMDPYSLGQSGDFWPCVFLKLHFWPWDIRKRVLKLCGQHNHAQTVPSAKCTGLCSVTAFKRTRSRIILLLFILTGALCKR